ncbi:MAG TPA: class I SAM-dependent methyltransferase [Vicinamibacterales bacterium]|nr:class I SAM-dependent methyltransferase [Vicinamibacterales bacterium]
MDFGGPYDAVLATNFLHHSDEATRVSRLKKILAALKPGGVAATLEFVPEEDRVSPLIPAQFAMMMPATAAAGDAYTFRDLERMHLAAGFASLDPNPVNAGPRTVVVAHA